MNPKQFELAEELAAAIQEAITEEDDPGAGLLRAKAALQAWHEGLALDALTEEGQTVHNPARVPGTLRCLICGKMPLSAHMSVERPKQAYVQGHQLYPDQLKPFRPGEQIVTVEFSCPNDHRGELRGWSHEDLRLEGS